MTPIVEHLDILEQVLDRFFACRIACAMDPFVLETVEEAFGRSIVPEVALAAHRARPGRARQTNRVRLDRKVNKRVF